MVLNYNVRLSIADGWKPTLNEFKDLFKAHGVMADAEIEYTKIYGSDNSEIGNDKVENEEIQPKSKGGRNSKRP